MSYSSKYNPLSKPQKSMLAQLARKAFNHQYELGLVDVPGETKEQQFTNWRHAEQAQAVGETSLTKCCQKDFLPLRGHFNSILGITDKAFEDFLKSQPANDRAEEGDTTEARTQKIHLIEEAIKDTKYRAEYVTAIAKNKFQKRKAPNLIDLTTNQLHDLLVTVKERIRRDKKKTKVDAAKQEQQAQDTQFHEALSKVDWTYQRAEGQAYTKGKKSFDQAQRLATTPAQKVLFTQRRNEKS